MTVLRCPSCDLGWQWPPMRDTEESLRHFRSNYAASQEGSYFDKSLKRDIAKLELEFLNSILPTKGSLLDVGSGDGTFAEIAFEDGWSVEAVDPAGPEREETAAGKWLRLHTGSLAELKEQESFDVLTLWDVIEHVERPLDLITDCSKHLAPGGWIVIETGNFGSTSRVASGKNWWCYQHDHRWYFSPKTLQDLLQRAGFGQFRLCERVLRPAGVMDGRYDGPSALLHLVAALRKPLRIASIIREYRELVTLALRYPRTAGLEIFALAACRRVG